MVGKCGDGEASSSIVDSVFEVVMDLLFCDIDGKLQLTCCKKNGINKTKNNNVTRCRDS